MTKEPPKPLPDQVHGDRRTPYRHLPRVGMGDIEAVVRLEVNGAIQTLPARLDAFVDLAGEAARGIHMSRMYTTLQNRFEGEVLSLSLLDDVCSAMVEGQAGQSGHAEVAVRFQLPMRRKALLSDFYGWRHYPIELRGRLTQSGFQGDVQLKLLYSSTCPCSAALARQLIANQFSADFGDTATVPNEAVVAWMLAGNASLATPHGQRSELEVSLTPRMRQPSGLQGDLTLEKWIDQLEAWLVTPVQTAVKRIDEQEFARLNGAHLVFAEDVARKLAAGLDADPDFADFHLRVAHFESLHSHNAVAFASKSGR